MLWPVGTVSQSGFCFLLETLHAANAVVRASWQAAEPADLVVSFPDDYPNSVRHFLMVGFMGFLIGAGIFFYYGYTIPVSICSA